MATRAEQLQAFKQGKQIDPRDVGATDFLKGKQIDEQAGVFLSGAPIDPSANVFINGVVPQHESAQDFIGQWGE